MEERIARLESRMTSVESQLADNTRTTNAIKDDTSEMLTLFRASKFGVSLVKWIATVGGGAGAAWAAFKGFSGR